MITVKRLVAAALTSAVLATAGGAAVGGAALASPDKRHHHNFHANKAYVDAVHGNKLLIAYGHNDRQMTVLLAKDVKVDGKESKVSQLHHGDIVNVQGYVADDDMAVVQHVVVTHRNGEKGDKDKDHGKKHGKGKHKGHGKKHGKGKHKGHQH